MEDIRCIKGEKKHNPSAALVEKSKEIIKKLQFAYHPDKFENPGVNFLFACIYRFNQILIHTKV